MKLVVQLSVLLVAASVASAYINKRIVNGEDAPQGKFPWLVSLKNDVEDCGGTLIDENWVLTAAHCVYMYDAYGGEWNDARNPSVWHVQAGAVKIEINPTESNSQPGDRVHAHVSKVIHHPKWNGQVLENDICLMKLSAPMDLNSTPNIKKVGMPSKSSTFPPVGSKCTLGGWGCTEDQGYTTDVQQLGEMVIRENTKCENYFKQYAGYPAGLNAESELCAGYFGGTGPGSCMGDSGGGLYCHDDSGNWVIGGVVSAGNGERASYFPGLYTRVAYHRDWIDQTMASN